MSIHIILRATAARLSVVNSDDLPGHLVEDGVRKQWVGIGWIECREAPQPDDYHIADDPHLAVAALTLNKEPRLVTKKEREAAKKRFFAYKFGKVDEALSLALTRLHPRDADAFKPAQADEKVAAPGQKH